MTTPSASTTEFVAANDNTPGDRAYRLAMQALAELMGRAEARRLAGATPANRNQPPRETTP